MDSYLECNMSNLEAAILDCKKDLTKKCFSKYGSAKLKEFDAYAIKEICDQFLIDKPEKQINQSGTYYSSLLLETDQYTFHRYDLTNDKCVKIEAKFDIGEGVLKSWYGLISLTENNESKE